MKISVPKGTKDILPNESYKWQYIENLIDDICRNFNYKEISTPVFEHTEVFKRGVGDTTDIVNKEMYTFVDKGDRSLTLKPEGTAPIVRSYITNSLFNLPQPLKLYYNTSCYRYERPQKGRFREFNQFGVEVFGTESYLADAEVISLANMIFKKLNIKDISLHINSIGCPSCRKNYNEALKKYFKPYLDSLCKNCNERYEKNPMRIIDCKLYSNKEFFNDAPKILDYICEDCSEHFESLKESLDSMGIKYLIDSKIVRGLDYYTRTVFEFISENIGSQAVVCGGGRYNGLVKQLGGPETPGIGFGMGLERLILTIEENGNEIQGKDKIQLFISYIGDEAKNYTINLAYKLRENNIICDFDQNDRSLKSQMKYANKLNALYSIVIGEDEIKNDTCNLKNMDTSIEEIIKLSDIVNIIGGK